MTYFTIGVHLVAFLPHTAKVLGGQKLVSIPYLLRGHGYYSITAVILTCFVCSKSFYKKPCLVKIGRGRYCSRVCYIKDQKGKDFLKGKRVILRGKDSPRWLGDKVSYRGLHKWIELQLGKPDTCENCGKSGLSGKFIQWANISGRYLRDLSDWRRLCVPCHMRQDGRVKQGGTFRGV